MAVVRSRSVFIPYCLGYEQVELLYRTTTNKCIRILLSHHVIYTMRHSKIFQPLKNNLQGVYLIHSSSKFNKMGQERESNPCTDPEVSSRLKLHRIHDDWHMKAFRLPALHTGRLNLQETFLVLISFKGWIYSRAIILPEGLRQ